MPETSKLPREYKPFKKLIVCGNTMNNGLVPISYHQDPIFLIGKGKEPKIWLNAMTSTGQQPLIRESRCLHDEVRIESKVPMTWTVLVAGNLVLEVFVSSKEKAEITKLDLRSVGYKVYGDQEGLNVGSNRLIHNVSNDVASMISFGGETKEKNS